MTKQPAVSEAAAGLPVSTFLSTLDWAAAAHQIVASSEDSSTTCPACSPPAALADPPEMTEVVHRLEGTVCFCVGREHVLAFSSFRAGGTAFMRIPVVMAVQEGKIFLGVQAQHGELKECLLLRAGEIVGSPSMRSTETGLCMEIVLPFLALIFECRFPQKGGVHMENGDSPMTALELKFSGMRKAIDQVREMALKLDQEQEGDKNKKGAAMSLMQSRVDEKRAQWKETGGPRLEEGFDQFVGVGADMYMPNTFPYEMRHWEMEGLTGDQSKQVRFVEMFVQQEALRSAVMEQAEAWVKLGTQARKEVEDRMLNKSEIEGRMKGRLEQS